MRGTLIFYDIFFMAASLSGKEGKGGPGCPGPNGTIRHGELPGHFFCIDTELGRQKMIQSPPEARSYLKKNML